MPIIFGSASVTTTPTEGICLRIITDFPSTKDGDSGLLLSCSQGRIIKHMIRQAGLENRDCLEFISLWETCDEWNSFRGKLCLTEQATAEAKAWGSADTGRWLTPKLLAEAKLKLKACREAPADMTVLLGDIVAKGWLGEPRLKLGANRGSVTTKHGQKCLATWHPRAVQKDWKLYSTVLMDLVKSAGESTSPSYAPPSGKMYLCQTLQDVHIAMRELRGASLISVDVETVPIDDTVQVDCIGFSPTRDKCFVIPIFDRFKLGKITNTLRGAANGMEGHSYEGQFSARDEIEVWNEVEQLFQTPSVEFVMQNGIYDTWILAMVYGLKMPGWHDTMIAQHVMFAELPKGLDYLGSIYTNRAPWKQGRQFGKKGE